MADPSTGQSKALFSFYSHVTIMVALMVISFGTLVRCDKKEVPSSPGSSFEFNDIDADNSGCVEGPEELQNFRIQVGRILGEALQLNNIERALRAGRITHSADVNGDGRICQCDLLSILLTESTGPGVHRHAFRVYEDGSFFDDVDANDDGVLNDVTEREALTQKLAQCVPVSQARTIVDAMSKLDKDDGVLTRDDYLLFLKSAQHQRDSDKSSPLAHSHAMPPALPQPQPQPLPQQPQGIPQPQPQPQSQNSPQNHPQTADDRKRTSSETARHPEDEGRPRKRVLPQPLQPIPGNPLQPAGQPWRQPQRHFQPMREAEQSVKALNPASHPPNQPAQPGGAANQAGQSLRSLTPRRQPVAAKRLRTRFSYQPEPAFSRGMHGQQESKRLENFYPEPQPGFRPDLMKLEQIGVRNQPVQHQPDQHQPDQPAPQPDHPKPLDSETKLQADLVNWKSAASNPNPSQSKSEPNHPKPQPAKVNPDMKNFSDQLEDVKTEPNHQPNPPQVQPTNKNLESELQKKKN